MSDREKGAIGMGTDTTLTANFDVPPASILDEVRTAQNMVVIGYKAGKPVLWSNSDRDGTQELIEQFFPEGVLLDHGAELARPESSIASGR